MSGEDQGKPVYFLGIDNVRFRKPVTPGDQLRLELEITKHRQAIWGFKGKALVDGKLVAEAELLAMMGEEKGFIQLPSSTQKLKSGKMSISVPTL